MPILDYAQWFGEAVNDPHGADFGPVLNAYRAAADNAATLAELNTTWAEDNESAGQSGAAAVAQHERPMALAVLLSRLLGRRGAAQP